MNENVDAVDGRLPSRFAFQIKLNETQFLREIKTRRHVRRHRCADLNLLGVTAHRGPHCVSVGQQTLRNVLADVAAGTSEKYFLHFSSFVKGLLRREPWAGSYGIIGSSGSVANIARSVSSAVATMACV